MTEHSKLNYMYISKYVHNVLFPKTAFIDKINHKYYEKYINACPLLKFEHEMKLNQIKNLFFDINIEV